MSQTQIERAVLFVRCAQALCGRDTRWKVAFGRLFGIKTDTVDAMAKAESRVPLGIWQDIRQHLRRRRAELQEIDLLIGALDTMDKEDKSEMFATRIPISHAMLETSFISPMQLAEANRRLASKPEFAGAVIVPTERGHDILIPQELSEEAKWGAITVFQHELRRAARASNVLPRFVECPHGIAEFAPIRFHGGPPLEGQSFEIRMPGAVVKNARIALHESIDRMIIQVEGEKEGWFVALDNDADAFSDPLEERWVIGGREPIWRTPELSMPWPRKGEMVGRLNPLMSAISRGARVEPPFDWPSRAPTMGDLPARVERYVQANFPKASTQDIADIYERAAKVQSTSGSVLGEVEIGKIAGQFMSAPRSRGSG
jgi:hypothetical protein